MCSVLGLRFLFGLFPAYVSCLGSYEGNMPATNVQRVPKHTFPEMGPGVKQVGNLIDPPHTQGNHRQYNSHQKESLFVGSRVKSDSKDCQTRTKHDNQNNIINKPFTSVQNYNLLAFGQPSSQFESNAATDVLENVQPVSQLAYTFSQGGSTLMETSKVFGSKTFKPSRGEFRYEAPISLDVGSSKNFAVQAPEHAYNHVLFKTPVSRDALDVGGPTQVEANSIFSQFSNLHGASQKSQSFRKFQAAGSTYGPILMGEHVHSRTNSRKPSSGGFTYAEAKPSVVSSGAIFIIQGSDSTQALGSTLSKSVKPLEVPNMVDFNQYVTPQSSQTSIVALNVGRQHTKLWNEPLYPLMREGQNGVGSNPPKQSGSYRNDDVGKSVSSSGEIRLGALKSYPLKSLPRYESREDVRHPGEFQKTYNTPGPSQTGYFVYSASGSKPNQVKPMHPTQNGVQQNVVKSSIASSGEIHMTSGPSKPQSFKLQVTSKPSASSLENRVKYPSSQTALEYQPFEASQNSNVQPTTGTFASPHQSGYKLFSSFRGISYKPGSVPSNVLSESRFSATNPSIDDSDEINAVRVRLNKRPQSNISNLQNQWASGNIVGPLTANSGALQSVLSSSNLGQRQGQNVQTPLVPLHHGFKKVLSQSAEIQENPDSMFGRGVIRRLSTGSSSFRPASQNQAQRVDSSAPGCEVTQNHLSGVGQQGPF